MYQRTMIVGHVGKDAEMRYTPQGKPVTSFSVATDRKYTDSNGEQVQQTTWFRVYAWNKMAEVCQQYVKKGMLVLVEGQLQPDPQTGGPRVYVNKSGLAGANFEVVAKEVKFLSRVGETASVASESDGEMNQALVEDDIPF